MTDGPRRIPDPAISELDIGGLLIYRLEHKQERDLSDLETAALVVSLRSMADALESTNLERPAGEILEESDHRFVLEDLDEPDSLG